MKTFALLCLTLAGVLSFAVQQTHAVWQTADAPSRVEYLDIKAGAAGRIYACGDYQPVTGPWRAILRRSLDGGQIWETVAMPATPTGSFSQFTHLTVDRAGQVYALRLNGHAPAFEVWRSAASDHGSNLVRVTEFDAAYLEISSLASDAAGNVYVTGFTSVNRWRTLKGVTAGGDGINWSVIDDYVTASPGARVKRLAVHPTLDAFRPAEIWTGGVASNLIVFRRTTDGGKTWTNTATFAGADSALQSIAVARDGSVYCVGRVGSAGAYRWLTHRSNDGGTSWTVVDDVGSNYGGRAVTTSPAGRVYASALRSAGNNGALMRTSASGDAGTWHDSDSYGLDELGHAEGITADSDGNVFVCGAMADPVWGFVGMIRKLSAPIGPQLSVTRFGNSIKLSWGVSETGFVAQASQTFSSWDWQTFAQTPTTNGNQQEIIVTAPHSNAFFRLLRP